MKIGLVSLGCPKNLVDGENMAQLLREAGYVEVDDPRAATALIVNTCGFIKAAEQESLDALDEHDDHEEQRAREDPEAARFCERRRRQSLGVLEEVRALVVDR